MNRKILLSLLLVSILLPMPVVAQDGASAIDRRRKEDLAEFGKSSIPAPGPIREKAKQVFAKPVAEQSEGELDTLAREANIFTNLITNISDEYKSQYNQNSRYEFVTKKLGPPHEAYQRIRNEFIDIRNNAYFNLGIKLRDAGRPLESFMYFRDAFRLSLFDCGKGKQKEQCMRWKAEQEMQKILKIEGITSYVDWQEVK
jgi:hypothetical protein